ncbi:MAG: DUF58 domain-containing protein [Propionibacteriaceae bacterium]|nr:DUF58 domain-containing protein [Propionibacteriaceae bacterium]
MSLATVLAPRRVKEWSATRWQDAAPLRAKLSPVFGVIQPAGWVCLAAAVACLAVGYLLGWAELIAAGVFLAVIVVIAAVFIIGRQSYAVNVDFSRLRVRVGDIAEAGLTISNTGPRSLLPCTFIVPVGKGSDAFSAPRLKPSEQHYESFRVPTHKRQVIPVGPVRSSRGDALGLLKREANWTDVCELFVHPLTVSLGDSSTGFLKDLEGSPTDALTSSDIAFHALRDYVVGDDLRHVHWRTSARIGRLMVRQFEETRRSHTVVCLSMSPEDYATDDDFELACSTAASLAQQAIRQEHAVTIYVPGKTLNTTTEQMMLDDCSRLEFGGACDPVTLTAATAAQRSLDTSVALVVTGGQIAPDRLHTALSRFSVDAYKGAIRCAVGQTPARNAIGGNPVVTVGRMDDLPAAVRGLGD